jgi:hypothetical protein
MLELQLILQPDAYKLTWHPRWRLPHQQSKHKNQQVSINLIIADVVTST